MSSYRIVLADDHAMLREGIKGIINETEDLKVVGEAADGLELLRLLNKLPADMVVLDISMPQLRGLEAAKVIKRQHPEIKILFLSMYKKREYLRLAVATGAEGYLLKEDTGFELIRAIETIRHGRTYLSSFILKEAPEDLIGISVWHRRKWIELANPNDPDNYARKGPEAFAKRLGLTVSQVFPISYDISKSAEGLKSVLKGRIKADRGK